MEAGELGRLSQDRRAGVGHRERAADARLDLDEHVLERSVRLMPAGATAPSQARNARFAAQPHQLVVGRVIADLIEPASGAIEGG